MYSTRKRLSARKPKHTKFGRQLLESARQILAHLRGEIELPIRRIEIPDDPKARKAAAAEIYRRAVQSAPIVIKKTR